MEVQQLNFKVNAESVVNICRQAWLYENKESWAKETIGYLAYGIPVDSVDAILNGIKTLKSTPDGMGCTLEDEKDESWLLEVQKHRAYLESKYYTFAGRKVEAEIVNTYTNAVVARLRNAMLTPGLMALENPTELMRLEEKRREMHRQIFKDAGYSSRDIHKYYEHGGSEEIREFGYELSKFVDGQTLHK